MNIKEEHPVLVIATANHCGYCEAMRGMQQPDGKGGIRQDSIGRGNGWPSVKNPMMIPPKSNYRWDTTFFKNLLTAGHNDGIQRIELFEVHYDRVFDTSSESLSEFSIFSLNKVGEVLIKKFKRSFKIVKTAAADGSPIERLERDEGLMHTTFVEGMEPSEVKWNKDIKTDFVKYRDSWIATSEIGPFQLHFPNIMYFSSTIWYSTILNNTSLYGYVPGRKVVYQPHDHLKYMVARRELNEKEDNLDPIEVVQMLLKDLTILHYPPEHGKIYMTLRN